MHHQPEEESSGNVAAKSRDDDLPKVCDADDCMQEHGIRANNRSSKSVQYLIITLNRENSFARWISKSKGHHGGHKWGDLCITETVSLSYETR